MREGITEKLNKHYGRKNPLADVLTRHIGGWTENVHKNLSDKGSDYIFALFDQWWKLQDFIEDNVGSVIEIYGKEQEQKEIIKEINTFYQKAYKHQNKKP